MPLRRPSDKTVDKVVRLIVPPDAAPEELEEIRCAVHLAGLDLVERLNQEADSLSAVAARKKLLKLASMLRVAEVLLREVGEDVSLELDRQRREFDADALSGAAALGIAGWIARSGVSLGARPLEQIVRAAKHCADALPMDRGRGSLARKRNGNPLTMLCRDCAVLLVKYRGESAAPISAHGPVYKMAELLWQDITGRDAASDNLERHAKVGATYAKKVDLAP